jgi:hypothetical protein
MPETEVKRSVSLLPVLQVGATGTNQPTKQCFIISTVGCLATIDISQQYMMI